MGGGRFSEYTDGVIPQISFQFPSRGFDRPRRATAAQKVVVAGEDANVQCDGQGYCGPVPRVPRNPTTSGRFGMFIKTTGDDLDYMGVHHLMHCCPQFLSLGGGQLTVLRNRRQTFVQLVEGFVPLVLGDHHL